MRAVETAGALGAYRDALHWWTRCRDTPHRRGPALLMARRGDLLRPWATPARWRPTWRRCPSTTGTEHRLVRARLARAAALRGELETAPRRWPGWTWRGTPPTGPSCWPVATSPTSAATSTPRGRRGTARGLLLTPDDPWQLVDLIGLQGLIAHQRGEWFERFRIELRRTRGRPGLATALFDAHLCVAEYLLYGPVPYDEVIEHAEELPAAGRPGRGAAGGGLRDAR